MSDFGQLDEQGQLDLLRSLQGEGAYTEETGTARDAELSGVARIAYLASETLVAAARNMLPSKSVELLDGYELLHAAPSNEQLTDTQRQSRLKAFLRALPRLLAHRLDNAAASLTGVTTGTTVSHDGTTQTDGGASVVGAFGVTRLEPSATAQDAVALDTIMRRGSAARSIVGDTATRAADYSGVTPIDRSILEDVPVGATHTTAPIVRPFDYYVGSTVRQAQWRELQAMLCWKAGYGDLVPTYLDQTDQGGTLYEQGSVATAATVSLDTVDDWSERWLQVWGVVSATDITPASYDLASLPDTDLVWTSLCKTGTTGAPYTQTLTTLAGGSSLCTVQVNGSGDLELSNTSGATRYYRLFVRASPKYSLTETPGSVIRSPWLDLEFATSATMSQLWKAATIRDQTLANAAEGGQRRVFSTGTLSRVATDETQFVVLDSSLDWRERVLLVAPLTSDSASANPSPQTTGVDTRVGTSENNVPRMFNTYTGAAIGSATAQPYQHADRFAGPNVWLFADSATGDLVAEMKSTDSTDARACAMFMVLASERTDGDVEPVPIDGASLTAYDLNTLQDIGCWAQGKQGNAPRQLAADVPGSAITAAPLGVISASGGMPYAPSVFEVRERIGRADDATFEQRQPVRSQRKIVGSILVEDGAIEPVDELANLFDEGTELWDVRDRFVWIEARASFTTDIRIGGISDNSADKKCALLYTGPHDTGDFVMTLAPGLTIFLNWSRLQLGAEGIYSTFSFENVFGSDYYVNYAIELSGHLGLADRRLWGENPAP